MQYAPHDLIEATFRPKRMDDLAPGLTKLIGKRLQFSGGWVIEDGYEYAGQIAWLPRSQAALDAHMGWAPTDDLEDIELQPNLRTSWHSPTSVETDEQGYVKTWKAVKSVGEGPGMMSQNDPNHRPRLVGPTPRMLGFGKELHGTFLPSPPIASEVPQELIDQIAADLKKLGIEAPKVLGTATEPMLVWDRQLTDEEIKTVTWYMQRRFKIPISQKVGLLSAEEMDRIERTVHRYFGIPEDGVCE